MSGLTSTEPAPVTGDLFSGAKLWFSHTVPSRQWLMENAKHNGAIIVPLERQADILLVDHARRNQPPGTHSYRFVELSIRNGALEDLDKHSVGPTARVDRPVGSVITASRGGRNAYTEEEDQFLWDVITPFRVRGGQWKGNEVYKQIERLRPRHTFQSWRDRYIKYVQYQNRGTRREVNAVAPEDGQSVGHQHARRAAVQDKEGGEYTPQADIKVESRPMVEVVIPTKPAVDVEEQHGPKEKSGPRQSPRKRPRLEEKVTDSHGPATPPKSQSQPSRGRSSSPAGIRESPGPPRQARRRPSVQFPDSLPFGFTVDLAKDLYKATGRILQTRPEKLDQAWEKLANEYEETNYTARQWRFVWETFALPRWCERRKKRVKDVIDPKLLISLQSELLVDRDRAKANGDRESSPESAACSQCFASESTRWKINKHGELLCQECSLLLKRGGLLRSSAAWTLFGGRDELEQDGGNGKDRTSRSKQKSANYVDVGTQSSSHQASPSHEPQSPTLARTPGANEARKRGPRSDSRSTSQGDQISVLSQDEIQPINTSVAPAKDQQLEEPALKKRKRISADELVELEIASNPESRGKNHDDKQPSLPEHDNLQRETSLGEVQLVSDTVEVEIEDHDDPGSEADTASLYAFETAPDMSQNWDTAPEVQSQAKDRLAAHVMPDGLEEMEVDTGEFDLPPPPGGWEVLGISSQVPEAALVEDIAVADESGLESAEFEQSSTSGTEGDSTMDGESEDDVQRSSNQRGTIGDWMSQQKELYSYVQSIEPLLSNALEATSMDFSLATKALSSMIFLAGTKKGQQIRHEGGVMIPDHIPGCWTEEDDNLLCSKNRRDKMKMEQKHGGRNCDLRYDFLIKWNES